MRRKAMAELSITAVEAIIYVVTGKFCDFDELRHQVGCSARINLPLESKSLALAVHAVAEKWRDAEKALFAAHLDGRITLLSATGPVPKDLLSGNFSISLNNELIYSTMRSGAGRHKQQAHLTLAKAEFLETFSAWAHSPEGPRPSA
jgi:hypothetical protein